MKPNRNRTRDLGFYVLIIVILIATIFTMTKGEKEEPMVYSDLVDLFQEEKVKSFVTEGTDIILKLRTGETDPATGEEQTEEKTYSMYSFSVFYEDFHELIAQQYQDGIIEDYDYTEGFTIPWWASFLPYLLLIGAAMWLWYMMMKQSGGAGGGVAKFSKARTRLGSEEKNKKTFNDVAGCE